MHCMRTTHACVQRITYNTRIHYIHQMTLHQTSYCIIWPHNTPHRIALHACPACMQYIHYMRYIHDMHTHIIALPTLHDYMHAYVHTMHYAHAYIALHFCMQFISQHYIANAYVQSHAIPTQMHNLPARITWIHCMHANMHHAPICIALHASMHSMHVPFHTYIACMALHIWHAYITCIACMHAPVYVTHITGIHYMHYIHYMHTFHAYIYAYATCIHTLRAPQANRCTDLFTYTTLHVYIHTCRATCMTGNHADMIASHYMAWHDVTWFTHMHCMHAFIALHAFGARMHADTCRTITTIRYKHTRAHLKTHYVHTRIASNTLKHAYITCMHCMHAYAHTYMHCMHALHHTEPHQIKSHHMLSYHNAFVTSHCIHSTTHLALRYFMLSHAALHHFSLQHTALHWKYTPHARMHCIHARMHRIHACIHHVMYLGHNRPP